jgi:hypothetical protein
MPKHNYNLRFSNIELFIFRLASIVSRIPMLLKFLKSKFHLCDCAAYRLRAFSYDTPKFPLTLCHASGNCLARHFTVTNVQK